MKSKVVPHRPCNVPLKYPGHSSAYLLGVRVDAAAAVL